MKKSTAKLAMLVILLVMSIPPGPVVMAQDKTPVGVIVSFDMPLLVHDWSDEQQAGTRDRTEQSISEILQNTFSYWDFRPGDDNASFLLTLSIRDPDPLDHRQQAAIFLETSVKGRVNQMWSHPWLDPTDFDYRIYPDVQGMPDAITTLFTRCFIENRQVDFGQWLRTSVPVARTGQWLPATDKPSLQIVLAIPFEAFNTLGYSIFVIKAWSPGQPPRTLEAQGIGMGLPYPPRSQPPRFLGLAVQPLETDASGQPTTSSTLLRDLNLGPVFLKREELYDYDY